MDTKKKGFIVNALRRASYRWPGRYTALKKAHIARNTYLCAGCGELFPKKQIQLDHINPVVPVSGWDNWEGYLERMFCEEEGFQVLCTTKCHPKKTEEENSSRKQTKKLIKKSRKKVTKK